MLRVQVPPNDSLVFHVQTKGGRKYIFQAESSDERTMWTSTLMAAIMMFEVGLLNVISVLRISDFYLL